MPDFNSIKTDGFSDVVSDYYFYESIGNIDFSSNFDLFLYYIYDLEEFSIELNNSILAKIIFQYDSQVEIFSGESSEIIICFNYQPKGIFIISGNSLYSIFKVNIKPQYSIDQNHLKPEQPEYGKAKKRENNAMCNCLSVIKNKTYCKTIKQKNSRVNKIVVEKDCNNCKEKEISVCN